MSASNQRRERTVDKASDPALVRFERKIRANRWAILVERAWPRLWLPLALGLVFILASLTGVWEWLAAEHVPFALGAFAVAGLLSLVPLLRLNWPTRDEGLRRLEARSNIPHRPASSWEDELAPVDGARDSATRTLWDHHRARMAERLAKLKVTSPEPRVERHDPLALRLALILSVVTALFFAGDAAYDRLLSAFRSPSTATVAQVRIDAWVTPPVYTGRPPVMLANGAKAGGTDEQAAATMEVPEASQLVVRVSGRGADRFSIQHGGDDHQAQQPTIEDTSRTGKQDATQSADGAPSDPLLREFRVRLDTPGTVRLMDGDYERLAWQFRILDDVAPTISLLDKPGGSPRGSLRLKFAYEDDYGVIAAQARIARPGMKLTDDAATSATNQDTRPDGSGQTAAAQPKIQTDVQTGNLSASRRRTSAADPASADLDKPIVFPLRMSRSNAKKGEGQVYQDLAAHPWAGLEVDLILVARDQAGQVGTSKTIRFKLPERRFSDPLARALVEQRRHLVRNSRDRRKVMYALDALTIAPDKFNVDPSVFLGMRSVRWRLDQRPTKDNIRSAIDMLWDIALKIEDGDLSQAERALREAQDKLSEALQNGASDEEIKKLMEELRQAMSRFLQSLSQQAQNNPQQQMQNPLSNNQMLTPRDLDQMLRNLEEMARNGSRDTAQQMLDQLRDMMERLQAGSQQGQNPQSEQARQMMEQFGKLIQEQQKLLDETFQRQREFGRNPGEQSQGEAGEKRQDGRRGQNGQRGEQRGRGERRGQQGEGDGENGQRGQIGGQFSDLAERQRDLRQQLDELLEGMRSMGAQTPESLEGAGEAMNDAERALGEENLEQAGEEESLALDRLRQGAQSMAEQMLQGLARNMRDPFGNPLSGNPQRPDRNTGELDNPRGNMVPGELEMQRAREILEELRRRAGDSQRPPLELDYIDRLLDRF